MSPLAPIVALALGLRLAIPLYVYVSGTGQDVFLETYSYDFLALAQGLLRGAYTTASGSPDTYYVPGYPFFLAPFVAFRISPLGIVLVQALLGCVSVYLVYVVSLRLFGREEPALWAAAAYAMEPLSIVFTDLVMPETLFILVALVFILLFLRFQSTGAVAPLSFAAGCCAVSAYVSPITIFLPLVVAAGLLLTAALTKRSGYATQALLFMVIAVLLVTPWFVRNYAATGEFTFTRGVGDYIYYQEAAAVLAETSGQSPERIRDELRDRTAAKPREGSRLDETADAGATRDGLKILAAHPVAAVKIHLRGVVRLFTGFEAHTYLRMLGLLPTTESAQDTLHSQGLMRTALTNPGGLPIAALLVILITGGVTYGLYVLAAYGLFTAKLPWRYTTAFIAYALYFILLLSGPLAYSRYRIPLVPVICIFAGYGMWCIVSRIRRIGSQS